MNGLLSGSYEKLLGMSQEDRNRAIHEDAWARELKKGIEARDSFIKRNSTPMGRPFEWTPDMVGKFRGEIEAAEEENRRREEESRKSAYESRKRNYGGGR